VRGDGGRRCLGPRPHLPRWSVGPVLECAGRDMCTSDAHGHAHTRKHTDTHTDRQSDRQTDTDTDTHNRKPRRACQPRPQSHTPHTEPQLGYLACGSLLSSPPPAPTPPLARPPPVARHSFAQFHWPAQIYTDSRRGGSRASLFHPKKKILKIQRPVYWL
jgi:hypothetical protein